MSERPAGPCKPQKGVWLFSSAVGSHTRFLCVSVSGIEVYRTCRKVYKS